MDATLTYVQESPVKTHFSIDDWLVQPELNALTRDGKTVHLEPKVMQVLVHLALHPGKVMSKEELIAAVWPDTFVSEQALTRCISVLRREMQDDTHTPRYIQTISKGGYRLVAEVRQVEVAAAPAVETGVVEATPPREIPQDVSVHQVVSAPEDAREPLHGRALRPLGRLSTIAGAVAVIVAVAGIWLWRSRPGPEKLSFRVVSLTSYAGQQDQAAFAPNGNSIAFVWTSPENGSRNIYVKQIGNETTLRLTEGIESDYSPVWSPDGTQIAYLSASEKGLGIYVVSSLGGPSKKVYTPQGIIHWEQGALSWSPDGKSLIFPDGFSVQTPARIYMESLDTMQARAITTPPAAWDGDIDPVFSPDGKKIAFIRASDNAVRDIYVMPAGGGELKQVTHDGHIVDSLSWLGDSNTILFSSDRGGKFALWKVATRGGEPERLPVGTEDAFQPAVHGGTHRLLYTQSSATWSIASIALRAGAETRRMVPVVSSTAQDSAPSFAPDGSRFAFQSWRSGTQQLWIASRDGSGLRQLTADSNGLTGSPSFSPDGQQVAFDSRVDGHSHIFVVAAAGGAPRQLTTGNANDILPRWSTDGHSVYFASNRSGSWQSWKLAVQGGTPRQITNDGGYVAMESRDGRWVYYTKGDAPGIWRMPAAGGAATRILESPRGGYWGYWCIGARGIYFLETGPPQPRIALYEFATEKILLVAALDHLPPLFSGLSVDTKDEELLLTDERSMDSHITLVENFR